MEPLSDRTEDAVVAEPAEHSLDPEPAEHSLDPEPAEHSLDPEPAEHSLGGEPRGLGPSPSRPDRTETAPQRPPRRISLRSTLILASVIAVIAVLTLGTLEVRRLGDELRDATAALGELRRDLTDGQRTLDQQRAEQAEADERQNDQLSEIEDRIDAGEERLLDASKVARIAKPAVFTVLAGNPAGFFQGSAFAFSTDGRSTWLVTNWHVIEQNTAPGTTEVEVDQGGRSWKGTVHSWNREADIALIEIPGVHDRLENAYGEGHDPEVGDPVMAYGSPYGLEDTATVGIVSAIRGRYVQTDAQINFGNSGGPLLNRLGEVIGVNTLEATGLGSGVGFAVDIRTVCNRLFESTRLDAEC